MSDQEFLLSPYMNGTQFYLESYVYLSWLKNKKQKDFNLPNIIAHYISDKEFPYKRYTMRSVFEIYRNLTMFKPKISNVKFVINPSNISFKTDLFHTYYLHEDNYVSFKDNDYYETHDIICDFFNEDPRVRSIGYNAIHSPMDYWTIPNLSITWIKKLIHEKKNFTTTTMRESIYNSMKSRMVDGKSIKTAEARQSKVTTYLSLFQFLKPKKVLDLASAYGERMLASIIDSNVSLYCGVDPNTDYVAGYDRIKSFFSDKNTRIITLPTCSEYLNIRDSKDERVLFDLAILSPAPYDTEIYSNLVNQASTLYLTKIDWLVKYLFMTIYKTYDHLSDDGRICITILDRIREDAQKQLVYTEVVCLFCLYIGFTYEGVIGWEAKSGIIPFWTFVKKSNSTIQEEARDKMRTLYPDEINMWSNLIDEVNRKESISY